MTKYDGYFLNSQDVNNILDYGDDSKSISLLIKNIRELEFVLNDKFNVITEFSYSQ